ncbi:hypothetical protein [Azohydromonas australica]|uniref:hypothetical protein n=1 Tax=Azohydromonas australica TaxID=364039 RepID=UPI0012EC1CFF|nr:hypothetical protein [Azohydromonas australica]
MDPLNYCTHAIEDYGYVAPGMARNGWPISAQAVVAATQLMHRAVKFNLPPGGNVLDINTLDESYVDLLVLPYPVVALEFPAMESDEEPSIELPEDVHATTRDIILLFETSLGRQHHPGVAPEAKRGITIWPQHYNDETREWAPSYATVTLDFDKISITVAPPEEAIDEYVRATELLQLQLGGQTRKRGYAIGRVQYWPALPELCDLVEERVGTVQAQAYFRASLSTAMNAALAFLLFINAANTGTKTLTPPEKLNKRRAERKKPPFYEAHILEFRRHDEDEEGAARGPMGTRESPRQHLRRSHLRRLKSGKAVVVKDAIVGNPRRGHIDKTYRISNGPH